MHRGNLVLLDIDNAEVVLESMLGVLSKVELGFEKAGTRAINKVLPYGGRQAARMVSGEFNLPQREVMDQLTIHRATYSNVKGELNFTGRGSLPLIRYAMGSKEPIATMPSWYHTPEEERAPGVVVKVKRVTGVSVLNSAFIAKMDSGHVGVFTRKDQSDWNSPITELYGTTYLA